MLKNCVRCYIWEIEVVMSSGIVVKDINLKC